MSASSLTTDTSPARQHLPDELRGLALLGIVTVNVPFLGLSLGGFGAVGGVGLVDRAAEFAVTAFAQGKFYLLFAFLFGYSAAIMMRRPGPESSRRFGRRLIGLGVLGVAHALLFFVGDILLTYAVVGVALLVLRSRPDRWVIGTAVVAAGTAVTVLAVVVTLGAVYPDTSGAEVVQVTAYDAAMTSGSFLDTVRARWAVYGGALVLLSVLNSGFVLSMFCLGLVAGRRNVLADPDAGARLWSRCRGVGLLIGLPGGIAGAVLTIRPDSSSAAEHQASASYLLGIALGFATAPMLTAGYVGAFVSLRRRYADACAVFRPAGRMSLTLYIGESALLAAVFCGWGFGLFADLGAAAALGVGIAAWLILDVVAHLWMSRHRHGPLEGVLRRWTGAGVRGGR